MSEDVTSDSHADGCTLYVVPACPLCASLRAELQNRGINFRERDVAHDFAARRRMYRLTRQPLVPVIEYCGSAFVRPVAAELDRILEKR